MDKDFKRAVSKIVHAMHKAGISESQILFCKKAIAFIKAKKTKRVAASGLSLLAEIAELPIPDNASEVFLRAFVERRKVSYVPTRSYGIVDRFSDGFRSMVELRGFLRVLCRKAAQQ